MRLRIFFSKTGSLRYTGHLDLHTLWERTIRRAGLPLLYTQGFHPGPRLQLASALPLGVIGRREIVDMWLEDGAALSSQEYIERIQPCAPPGLTVLSAEAVEERSPALQTQVSAAEYEVTLLDPLQEAEATALPGKIEALLQAETLPAERRGKAYDLRPLIEAVTLLGPAKLFMRLAAREGATGRPEAVLEILGIPFEATRIERTRLLLKGEE